MVISRKIAATQKLEQQLGLWRSEAFQFALFRGGAISIQNPQQAIPS